MHIRYSAKTEETKTSRLPVRSSPAPVSTPPPSFLALQRSAGNATVIQMLRKAGHPGAQEEQQHGADRGHRQPGHPVQRSTVHDVLRTPGRPLNDDTRIEMEARLGADFSDVRIHSDATAKASAAEVGARAYTSGEHVVMGDGGVDKHTLAHELTHVVQQRRGPVAGVDDGTGLRISAPSDRFERAAEANAARVMSRPVPDSGVHVQRTADESVGTGSPGRPEETIQRSITIASSGDSDAMRLGFEEAVKLLLGKPDGAAMSMTVVSRMVQMKRSFANADEFAAEVARESGVGTDGSLTLGELSNLTRQHTERVHAAKAEFDSDRSAMLRGIVSGSTFSSKYDAEGRLGGDLDTGELEQLKSRVQDFHQFTSDLRDELPQDVKSRKMRLYRSTDVAKDQLKVGGKVRQALPFSATYSYDFTAQEWGDKPVVLAIDVPMNHQLVSLSQVGGGSTGVPLNQDQLEVVVGPCTLEITDVSEIGERTLASAVVAPLSQKDVAADIDEAIERSSERRKRKREAIDYDDADLPTHFEGNEVKRIRSFTRDDEGTLVTTKQGKSLHFHSGDDLFGWTFQE